MHSNVMERPASTDAAMWRPGATRGQLLRAAAGLESIADTCAGRRRDELLDLAENLRVRAWSGLEPEPDEPLQRRRWI
jgi:hypothetical protein